MNNHEPRVKRSFRLDPRQDEYLLDESERVGVSISRLVRHLLDHAIRLRRAAKARGR